MLLPFYNKCWKCSPWLAIHVLQGYVNKLREFYQVRASHLHSCRSSSMVSGHCDFHKLTVSCNPHRQKSHALRWAERGGQATRPRPFLQTHWMGKLLVNHSVTDLAKCGGASSCKYHMRTYSPKGTSTSTHLAALPISCLRLEVLCRV